MKTDKKGISEWPADGISGNMRKVIFFTRRVKLHPWTGIVFAACLLLSAQGISGQVRLPRLESDGMVLQRDAPVRIWGWASPGEKLSLGFRGRHYRILTNSGGTWQLLLPPMKAGGPYQMDIESSNRILLSNILIGDVWVCSGQSNMVLPMQRVAPRYRKVIAEASNPEIREFHVPDAYDFNGPRDNLYSGSWKAADSEQVLQFSAAGYFFARQLFKKYHVPIGLIVAAVGGTPIQSWLGQDALQQFPDYLKTAELFNNPHYLDSIRQENRQVSGAWYRSLWKLDRGMHGPKPWYDTSYDASAWPRMNLPGYWNAGGPGAIHGVTWFRKTVYLPPAMTGIPAMLLLGRIVDRDSVYVNGKFAGTTGYKYPPRRYHLPPGMLRPGKNIIVVRVINYSGLGGFIKDKPYLLQAGGLTKDLKGMWRYKIGAVMGPLAAPTFIQYEPLGLFNGMISPLLPYTIRGIVWYQGESNTEQPGDYHKLFTSLIGEWRKKWKEGNIPFLFVQLPNYGKAVTKPVASGWARVREAQLRTLSLPNTGMAVTIDIGEWNDIHPLDKEDVGRRLALAAERLSYGDKGLVFSGPIYQGMQRAGNRIIIRFSHEGGGLEAKGGKSLKCFTIAGKDGTFFPAEAKISGQKVIVWSSLVAHPEAVRYGWADNPAGANLINKEGLPASPFRTDDWTDRFQQ